MHWASCKLCSPGVAKLNFPREPRAANGEAPYSMRSQESGRSWRHQAPNTTQLQCQKHPKTAARHCQAPGKFVGGLRLAALASATPRTRIMACLCLLPEARCRKTSLFTSATSHLQTTCKSRAVGFQLFVLHNRENNNRQVPDVMPKPVKILLKLSASFGLLAWCTRARA